ncbi:recombinase family protein [Vibrio porteresiae]|uniref:Recombinase family protein n=1 Tax=Vibrio porteresiae DSM 19223 TaxID=1123496 RepID=A0ABZ0QCH3_9VIBR|nr:recombinase family protein [Vibrio porteresiae]WPC74158.1 recombinase family protein [Vibrio porteresiae DSM 19223]WPC74651.1 recombinase family protein [Vibrio porteresiae DSM 19223]
MQKIIYPYVRFSSEQQSGGSSYKRQLGDILKYAKENGYTVNDSLELRDLGLSAYKADHIKKGSLGDFFDAIDTGIIETDGTAYLCVEQFDRLSRQSLDDASDVLRKILRSNINVITLMDKRVYTKESLNDLMSVMYSSMLMAQANEESAKKSERILKSFDARLDALHDGKQIQYVGIFPGWIDNKGTKKETNFVLNKKAEIVKRIFKMYINGISFNEIARTLNYEKTPQVAKKRQKNFTNLWSSAKVNHILKNRCVLGELYIRKTGDTFKNYYPQIISNDDWDIVQSMTKTKKTIKTSGRNSINIFTGKIFCSGCGQKYYFETDDKILKSGKKYYHMLKCSGRRGLQCKSASIKYDDFLISMPNMFGLIDTKPQDNSDKIKKIKEKIAEISSYSKSINEKLLLLEELNNNDELDFTIYLKESSKLQKQIRENDARIASFKVSISRLSSDNKLDYFDKNDPISIKKAKKFINENFAGFIISSDSRNCTALYNNGQIIYFKVKNSKIEKTKNIIEKADGFKEFFDLKEEVVQAYKNGTMDGRFSEILKATNFWGIETPEKYYTFE